MMKNDIGDATFFWMVNHDRFLQPPGIKHTVLGYSDDCELLEIVLPADFKTVMLE